MIHFLIGLILAGIAIGVIGLVLSTPAGRLGCAVVGIVVALGIMALIGGNQSSRSPPQPRADPVAAEAARQAAAAEAQKRRERIPIEKVSLRDLEVLKFGKNILEPPIQIQPDQSYLTVTANARNGSADFVLVGVVIKGRIFDCPATPAKDRSNCELVQEFRQRLATEVPPTQTRYAQSREFNFHNFPRPRGRLVLDYEIVETEGIPPES